MRFLLTPPLVVLALAAMSAEKIPFCPIDPASIPALTAEAESGDPKAQVELGQAYFETREPEKLSQSAYWFERAAEQGYADAEMKLSEAYATGEGVSRDDKSALHWLNKAAEDGQAQAQWVLGMNYRDGRYVERDARKTFDWFLRAAKQGHVDAQVGVAKMYEEGDWVPQDYSQAVIWYRKAAEHVPDYGGAGQARNNLGMLYLEGHGVSQDYVTAYIYFALANSKQNMKTAAKKMTSSQIAEAQGRAKEWAQRHPQPQMCGGGIGFSKASTIPEDSR